jgi:hypothetical protein
MQVPEKWRTRGVYAGVAMAAGLLFSFIAFGIILTIDGTYRGLVNHLGYSLFGLLAGPCAALAWPSRRPRRGWQMLLAGFVTIALSFLLMGYINGVYRLIMSDVTDKGMIQDFLLSGPLVLMVGSGLTFGAPYFMGALISWLFRDVEDAGIAVS